MLSPWQYPWSLVLLFELLKILLASRFLFLDSKKEKRIVESQFEQIKHIALSKKLIIKQHRSGQNKQSGIICACAIVSSLILETLSWTFIVLTHYNTSPRIGMSLHSDTLSSFRTNQPLFLNLFAECLAEKQQLPILLLSYGNLNPRSTTLDASTQTITLPIWSILHL